MAATCAPRPYAAFAWVPCLQEQSCFRCVNDYWVLRRVSCVRCPAGKRGPGGSVEPDPAGCGLQQVFFGQRQRERLFTTDRARIEKQSNVTLGYQRFIDPDLAVGVEHGIRRSNDVEIDSNRIGSLKGEKYGLTTDYYFGSASETVRPFAGAGLVHRRLKDDGIDASGQALLGADARLESKSTVNVVGRVGADFKVAENAHCYVAASWEPFTNGDLRLSSASTRPLSIGAGLGF
jgi:outer membrane protein W